MIYAIIVAIATCLAIVVMVCKVPSFAIGHHRFDTFWIIALAGAIIMIIFGLVPLNLLFDNITSTSSLNPIKIIVLLLTLTLLSITLDELGFFDYIATKAVAVVGKSQYKLFFILYIIVAFLTIFTSNDIVILTFTLFICSFARKAKINPIPYLVMEFVTANTYSMFFIIGNPTNIYLANAFNIAFDKYFIVMFLPTIGAGLTSLGVLILLFNKYLKKPLNEAIDVDNGRQIAHKGLTIICLIHLLLCTVMLAISNYVHIDMMIITIAFALSLTIVLLTFGLIHHDFIVLNKVYKRLPYTLGIFVFSMYVIVLALDYHGVMKIIADFLSRASTSSFLTTFIYGTLSTISCNLINNIPMALGFSSILTNGTGVMMNSIYATIIGSNIGAFITPIGALAGIMWVRILKEEKVAFTFKDFTKYGLIIACPVLVVALLLLWVVL